MARQEQAVPTLSAIYEHGVLRLTEPLDLPEHTQVHITVTVPKNTDDLRDEELRTILGPVGLQLVEMPPTGRQPLTEEDLDKLIDKIGPGVKLSEAILQERKGR